MSRGTDSPRAANTAPMTAPPTAPSAGPTIGNGLQASGSQSNGASAAPQPAPSPASANAVRDLLAGKHVCPFCGTQRASSNEPCPRCTMEDTAATRQATKARIGPWYVLQTRNPSAPGMKFNTLLALVSKGQISARSIVRGPTTHQLWRFAAHVRGLSREFGICYSCGEAIDRLSPICQHCERSQDPPADPDQLLDAKSAPQMPPPAAGMRRRDIDRRDIDRRDYELPAPPAAHPLSRRPAETRGEHAERLRLLNNEGAAGRAMKPELARRPAGRLVSGVDLASAMHPDSDYDEEVRGTRGRGIFAIVFMLVVLGAGFYFYFNPESRRQTVSWIVEEWQSIQQRVDQRKSPGRPVQQPPTADLAVPSSTDLEASAPTKSAQPDAPTAVAPPAPLITQTPAVDLHGHDADAGNARGEQQQADQQQAAVANPNLLPKLDKNGAVSNAPADEDDASIASSQLTGEAAMRRERKLWSRALDAEANADFAEAVRCYEEIKQLPASAHPAPLQLRLDNARRAMNR